MKLKNEVCRCDRCNQLFEKDFVPLVKIQRHTGDTLDHVVYQDVDLCEKCIKSILNTLENKSNE